jgi:hypothetical protein
MQQAYCLFPGEFVCWELPCGASCIGRCLSVAQNTLSVSQWNDAQPSEDEIYAFHLPPITVDSGQLHVIPTPFICSLVFVFNKNDFSTFKVRYIHGKSDVYCTRDPYQFS